MDHAARYMRRRYREYNEGLIFIRIYLQKITKEWHNQGKLKQNILNVVLESVEDDKKKGKCCLVLTVSAQILTIFMFSAIVDASLYIYSVHWQQAAGIQDFASVEN